MKTQTYDIHMPHGAIAGVASDWETMKGEVAIPVQTHSCNVAVIGRDGIAESPDDTDAIICLDPGVKIGVRTADCVPVVVYAPDIRAVAAIHAGWKGSLGGIVDHTLDRLLQLGASPAMLHAAFGPSVCGDCYEVSEELAESFASAGFAEAIPSHRHIDLERVNTMRLLRRGIPDTHIIPRPACTLETTALPSWRRHPTPARLLTWISLTETNRQNS